ncbi:uncharacterized protein ATNIH1004_006605 [Aspergillus tanneri]|uniref:Uncharacterized protein n=2 Tax=Aspergillus tanneri TaxID=1220188 RepID=A0A5M9MSQ1_9EURO|nr:uncharacterized protein ATNIH1004_006605 [Aspergillus tanneri]KAA8647903.1 hypothetical protein ATNIH1004_006605 [Aspergillus tanneri]
MSAPNQPLDDLDLNPYLNHDILSPHGVLSIESGNTFSNSENVYLNSLVSGSDIVFSSHFNCPSLATAIGREDACLGRGEASVKGWGTNHDSAHTITTPNECREIFSGCFDETAHKHFNIDNFSTPSVGEASMPTARTSHVNDFGTSIQKIISDVGTISERVERGLSVVEGFAAKTQDILDAFNGLHEKINNMSSRVDGLAEMLDEVVKCERLAMEKFGNLAKRIERPVSSRSRSQAT